MSHHGFGAPFDFAQDPKPGANNDPAFVEGWGVEGGFRLRFQSDGNLVISNKSGTATWATGTGSGEIPSQQTPSRLVFQSDGNLVMYGNEYAGQAQVIWATDTSGHPNAVLLLQSDGNLVMYDPYPTVIWASNGKATGVFPTVDRGIHSEPAAYNGKAQVEFTVFAAPSGQSAPLTPGTAYASPNGQDTLEFTNGQLVLTHGGQQLWASPAAHSGQQCTFSGGRLSILDKQGTPQWQTPAGSAHALLCIQNDGNVVIYDPYQQSEPWKTATWSTGTTNPTAPQPH